MAAAFAGQSAPATKITKLEADSAVTLEKFMLNTPAAVSAAEKPALQSFDEIISSGVISDRFKTTQIKTAVIEPTTDFENFSDQLDQFGLADTVTGKEVIKAGAVSATDQYLSEVRAGMIPGVEIVENLETQKAKFEAKGMPVLSDFTGAAVLEQHIRDLAQKVEYYRALAEYWKRSFDLK